MITCFRPCGGKAILLLLEGWLISFGSELKALMAHPRFKRELDLNAVASLHAILVIYLRLIVSTRILIS